MSQPPTPIITHSSGIRAEVHTDDWAREVTFDASLWFHQAAPQEIRDLAGCDWGGDYPADAVALWFERRDPEVEDLFEYLRNAREALDAAGADGIGFECHVDEGDALAWLRQHRPDVFAELSLPPRPDGPD